MQHINPRNRVTVIFLMWSFLSASAVAQGTLRNEAPPADCATATKVQWLQTHFSGTETVSVISVKAPRGCVWTVQSQAAWMKFHRTEFRGNAVFSFKMEPNGQSLRTGVIELAGQTFTITQNKTAASSAVTNASTNAANPPTGQGVGGGAFGSPGYYGSNSGNGGGGNLSGSATYGGMSGVGGGAGLGAPTVPMVSPLLAGSLATPQARWTRIDDTGAVATLVAVKDQVYQLRKNGTVLHYKAEEKWEVIDTDPNVRTLVAWQNRLYQWCLNKGVSVWNEDARRWFVVDAEAQALAVTADYLYTLRPVGLWQYNGKTWNVIEAGFTTLSLAATSEHVYQLRNKQGVWEFDEKQREWKQIDTTVEIKSLTAHGRDLYQTRTNGGIWWYTGTAWQAEQGKIPTRLIVATDKAFYHLDENGQVWKASIS